MRNFILPAFVAATLSAGVAMPAMAQPLHHFSRDGENYSYVVDRQQDGVILLRGTVDTTGDAFALSVRGNQVDGTLGMSKVSFRISPATMSSLSDEVAANTAPTTLASN